MKGKGVLFSDKVIIVCKRQCDLRRSIKMYLRYFPDVHIIRFIKDIEI